MALNGVYAYCPTTLPMCLNSYLFDIPVALNSALLPVPNQPLIAINPGNRFNVALRDVRTLADEATSLTKHCPQWPIPAIEGNGNNTVGNHSVSYFKHEMITLIASTH